MYIYRITHRKNTPKPIFFSEELHFLLNQKEQDFIISNTPPLPTHSRDTPPVSHATHKTSAAIPLSRHLSSVKFRKQVYILLSHTQNLQHVKKIFQSISNNKLPVRISLTPLYLEEAWFCVLTALIIQIQEHH